MRLGSRLTRDIETVRAVPAAQTRLTVSKANNLKIKHLTSDHRGRLLETLIIEVYENAGRAADIKGTDGNFFMLNGLISHLESNSSIHLGRNAARGLRDSKQIGDLSAHNRRFNARQNDIDRVRDGLRVASEELLHLAGLANAKSATSVAGAIAAP